jgi:Ca2+-binding RTX toxin-like protein
MSTPTTRRRKRLGWLVGLVAALGAFLTLGAGSAFGVACVASFPAVNIISNGETVTIAKGPQERILVNGVDCTGPAGTVNFDTIAVFASGISFVDVVNIDMGGGRFEPGSSNDLGQYVGSGGLQEMEFYLQDVDGVNVLGDAAPDNIIVGAGGVPVTLSGSAVPPAPSAILAAAPYINLNGDIDGDVYFVNTSGSTTPPVTAVFGRGGADFITFKGGLDTGLNYFGNALIDGGAGDDHLQGGGGDDVLVGGAGDDVMDGNQDSTDFGASNCEVDDDVFIDLVSGEVFGWVPGLTAGDTAVYAGSAGPITADLDPAEAHPGTATGDGTDTLQNIENLVGSPADDTLSGDNDENLIAGGAGNDTLAGDADDDCVFGQDGNDTLDENEGTSVAQGGSGTTNGSDFVFGNAGLDDTITYSARTTRVVVYLESFDIQAIRNDDAEECDDIDVASIQDGADLDGDGSANDDEEDCVYLDTENVVSGSGNDILVASFINNRADNEFTGNGGNDLMDGGAGNDTFHEGTAANGADDMDGGTGSDTCDYSGRTGSVSVSLDAADNDGEAGEGDNCGGVVNFNPPGTEEGDPVSAQDVENVLGGSGNDVLVGSDDANTLVGNAGNDTISGLGGTDSLSGGDGDDSLAGGGGNDAIDGGAGTDSLDYSSSSGGVVINLAAGTSSGEGNDTLTGNENASGSSFQDSIRGDSGNNVLNGRGGNDAIQGLDGADTINGAAGNDELGGGAGDDRVTGGTGSDAIRGGGGDDRLQGGPGPDVLMGGAGDDVLSGNAGPDDHRGGPGTDRCIPGSPGLARGDTASGCES